MSWSSFGEFSFLHFVRLTQFLFLWFLLLFFSFAGFVSLNSQDKRCNTVLVLLNQNGFCSRKEVRSFSERTNFWKCLRERTWKGTSRLESTKCTGPLTELSTPILLNNPTRVYWGSSRGLFFYISAEVGASPLGSHVDVRPDPWTRSCVDFRTSVFLQQTL